MPITKSPVDRVTRSTQSQAHCLLNGASLPSTHSAVVATGASCMDCHNPHSPGGQIARRVTYGNEPACLSCHSNLRGPFVFEHAPLRLEGCSSCHVPHGSANPKMLTRGEVRTVCLECHSDLNGVNGASGGALGVVPPAFHDIRNPRIQACSTCHRKIHGSYVDRSLRR
jgi:DmsE family decaheme c-type cytochrome